MDNKLLIAVLLCGCGTPTGPSTYAALNTQVFGPYCGLSDSCHTSAGARASAMLDLKTDAYTALVGVAAANPKAAAEGRLRVKPNDSANSFLYMKLTIAPMNGICPTDTFDKIVGYGSCMPLTSNPLDSGTLAGIKLWIDSGAKNN